MKKFLSGLILALVLLSAECYANPLAVSDPYPITAIQPTGFVATLNGTTYTVLPSKNANNLVYFSMDLAGKWTTGANSLTVKATTMWGESSASIPLTFTAAVPVAPSGVVLQP
jgi:hypothetical protein